MARYIDADKLWNARPIIPKCKSQDYTDGFTECMFGFSKRIKEQIDNTPTADVVPRAEVDKLRKERDEYRKHVDEDIIYVHRIQSEVAREIFEEIMSEIEHICLAVFLLAMTGENEEYLKGFADACGKVSDFIRELKKKYPEGGDQE